MDDFQWVPPGLEPDQIKEFLTPDSGLPNAATELIHVWIVGEKSENDIMSWTFMLGFQAAAHIDLGLQHKKYVLVSEALKFLRGLSQEQRLFLVDYMLSGLYPLPESGRGMPTRAEALAEVLRVSGAGWRVANRRGRWGLERVIPAAVAEAAEAVLGSADRASSLLRSAWSGAFGVDPNPSHAYYDAVRAVEVYSCPLISKRDSAGTLGKDINVLRNKPEAWTFALAGSNRSTAMEHLVSVMQLLWHSQTDRHGTADYQDVSVDEAQAAVLLASTLVGWFSQGALREAN